ncbi:MAG: helix-turn-helix domain-containing protein [Woeseia sp.]
MRAAEFVESYFEAWNHRDPLAVADHLASNGIYCDVPEQSHHAHDELVAYLREFFAANRHQYRLVGDLLASEHTIAFQYEILPGTGEPAHAPGEHLRGAEFITLHEDAALSIVDYYGVAERKVPSDLARITSQAIRTRKYAKSGLNHEQMAKYRDRLDRIMQSQQLFLHPDMTLPRLAAAVGCSVNHLSQVINAGIGTSFFEYMNRYRVAYARELLSSPEGQSIPILSIAFTVGFNSNSAFYAAFKKCVGQTPAQYRKQKR